MAVKIQWERADAAQSYNAKPGGGGGCCPPFDLPKTWQAGRKRQIKKPHPAVGGGQSETLQDRWDSPEERVDLATLQYSPHIFHWVFLINWRNLVGRICVCEMFILCRVCGYFLSSKPVSCLLYCEVSDEHPLLSQKFTTCWELRVIPLSRAECKDFAVTNNYQNIQIGICLTKLVREYTFPRFFTEWKYTIFL